MAPAYLADLAETELREIVTAAGGREPSGAERQLVIIRVGANPVAALVDKDVVKTAIKIGFTRVKGGVSSA
jgi:hypothetical protein